MEKINVKILSPLGKIPVYSSEYAAAADLFSAEERAVAVAPGETVLIHTGIAMEIPVGYAGFVYARSGLASKRGLAPANKVGVIDADYRGEIMVALHNHSSALQTVESGERIAQMVIAQAPQFAFCEADELTDTLRSDGGFGSTGRK